MSQATIHLVVVVCAIGIFAQWAIGASLTAAWSRSVRSGDDER